MESLTAPYDALSRAQPIQYAGTLIAFFVVFFCGRVIYNVFFHPLRKFPGPFVNHASGLWKTREILSGTLPQSIKRLHDEYGPVVRVAPNELSFIKSQAWKDIYGHHGSYEMAKADEFYRPMGNLVPDNIITADRGLHSLLRRQLAHGFSERSMRGQEPIVGSYVDMLMTRLEEHGKKGREPLDLVSWLNFTTFDIIGNLGFGSDFGCLENSYYHPWVEVIAHNLKESAFMRVLIQSVPPSVLYLASELGAFKGRAKHIEYSQKKLEERIARKGERPDLIEGLVKKLDVLTMGQVEMNASVLIIAGSETTATLLSGAFFLIASNPEIMKKLTEEVRSSFKDEREITLLSVNKLNYMLACLNESLRMYPPVAIGLPRVVPKGGCEVAGYFVPQDTIVSVPQLATNYNKSNFTNPEDFNPNRYLGDETFASDDLSASQPFSVGPRNCIGRNLAYAEMRLIAARILFKFDVELAPGSEDWIKRQKVYTLWEKPQLPVYLKPAHA